MSDEAPGIALQDSSLDERGASAVEYGLLIAGIAALIVVTVFAFGGMVQGVFTDSCTQIVEHSVSPGYDCRAG